MKLLLLDNYDSFSYNLYQRLGSLKFQIKVERNDAITLSEIRRYDPDCIVISPGPGNPSKKRYFGVCGAAIREMGKEVPVLGVCLGHQGIAHEFGGRVVHAARVMHGKSSEIMHSGEGIFEGIESPTPGGRYHSLIVERETLPSVLRITAQTAEGEIMALQHRSWPIYGVQFHPESILTPDGMKILSNFRDIVRGRL